MQAAPLGKLSQCLQVKCALVDEVKLQFPFSSFKWTGLPEEYSQGWVDLSECGCILQLSKLH